MTETVHERSLTEALIEMENSPVLYRPAVFWENLGASGLQQLQKNGFGHFKRTLNMRYFNWDVRGIVLDQFPTVFSQWCRHPDLRVFQGQFLNYRSHMSGVKSFNVASAFIYKVYVSMLWEYVSRLDRLGLLTRLEEPQIGNPFLVSYKNHSMSQDLCNSVHEFYSAGGGDMTANNHILQIAELGAGYGRLAHVFLEALPHCSYCVIDIPPALYIAQRYLNKLFPKEKIFPFRRFSCFEDVRSEFQDSRIKFLTPSQIEMLPLKQFDLFLNISSLHEMTYPQIKNYLIQINRLCRGDFYTKQWRVSRDNDHLIKEHDYPLPQAWQTTYHRTHPIHRMFFEAKYHVGIG